MLDQNEEEKLRYVRCGAFCVYHGWDRHLQTAVLLLIERGDYQGTRRSGYGVPGGHIDVETRTEQPREAAIRELCEEIRDRGGRPVLTTITPDRLRLMDSGIDYQAASPGSLKVGVNWQGYCCTLTEEEVDILRRHCDALNSDPAYAKAARLAARNEVHNVCLIPAAEFLTRHRDGRLDFTYDHERAGCIDCAQGL